MRGEYEELMTFKQELDRMSQKSSNPFVNIYRKWKKKKIINETGFEYCQEFLSEMNYTTLRRICNLFNNLNDKSYSFKDPFYDEMYDRDLQMRDLRVIMGDYYVELIINIKVKSIPMIRRTDDDNIISMKYDFMFNRSGYINIKREALVKHVSSEHKVVVDGMTSRGLISGLYEYFIIKNTFYKALTYYIFNFLNK